MKLTVCFGDTKVVVPCGSGDISIRDLAFNSLKRVRNTIPKLGPHDRIVVHNVTIARDGGILDWDDLVRDVLDDRELVTAHYSIATPAVENSGENPDVLSAENTSDPLFQISSPLIVDLYSHNSIVKSKQAGSQSSRANRFEENAVRSTTVPLTAKHLTTFSTGQSSPPPGDADQNDLLCSDGLVACDGSTSASSSSLSLNVSSGSCCVPAQSGWATGLSGGTADPALRGHRISLNDLLPYVL